MEKQVQKLTLAHSPDSDDAFMFWALKEGRVTVDGVEFRHILSDIQGLNQAALEGRYDISAISLHVYPYVANQYLMLNAGASIGDGYGPRVVSKKRLSIEDLANTTVAIPGSLTTAALVLKIAVPGVRTEEMQFDKVLEVVKTGRVEAGLLIHEGQITFEKDGLHLVCDFGEWWKSLTGLPLPLGANIIKRSLGDEIINKCGEGIRNSVKYGLSHREEAVRYAQDYGRNLVHEEVDRFVSMYVNDFTVDWGETGKKAVKELLRRGAEAGITPELDTVEFAG